MPGRYWIETLGCPKNQVDSDKLTGTLQADGLTPAEAPDQADVVVVNTCAFIEAARQESIEAVLNLAEARRAGSRLVVTGCMAERYGDELVAALPEADLVAGFGVPVTLSLRSGTLKSGTTNAAFPRLDLLNLPRPKATAPWAYVKVAEGCDRHCGFCAIPSFRGRQRSRLPEAILDEVDRLEAREIVLVAQDLASYGRDLGRYGDIVPLVEEVSRRVDRTRLLYLYPSELTDGLIDVMGDCPYFDLSLQHVAKAHLRRMRRWGDGDRFKTRIEDIRRRHPDAAFRSSFIVGYPGETEEDHDQLLGFLETVELDWAGFFAYSREEGTYAAGLPADRTVDAQLVAERLGECQELQDAITARRRSALIGETVDVLVDEPGVARSHREAPEIDGVIHVPSDLPVGGFATVTITEAAGPDLEAVAA